MPPQTRGTARGRAAKTRANTAIRETFSEDGIALNMSNTNSQAMGNTILDYSEAESSACRGNKQASRVSPHDSRVENLEEDMAHVKRDISGINGKLDMLLSATLDKPLARSTPPKRNMSPYNDDHDAGPPELSPAVSSRHASRTQHAGSRNGRQRAVQDQECLTLPPPRTLRQQANKDGYVDAQLAREELRVAHTDGKSSVLTDIFITKLIAKPYMYVDRDGLHTIKQKLDVRATLTVIEYTNAMIALLCDSRAFQPTDINNILQHLYQVTLDSMSRPWPAVRKWSQYIWDCVENHKCTWADYTFIQNERVRLAMTGAGTAASQINFHDHGGTPSGAHITVEVVCRDFNSPVGCRHNATHEQGNMRFAHICSYCDACTRRCYHSFQACRRKQQGNVTQDATGQIGAATIHQHPNSRNWPHGKGSSQLPKNGY